MKALYIALCFYILNTPIHATSKGEIDLFIQSLPIQEKMDLEVFFEKLMDSTGSGTLPSINYALWGDKPLAINAYWIADDTGAIDGLGETESFIQKGYNFWERLSVSPNNKKYFFLIFQEGNHKHLVCINRQAFLDVVRENINLFRYVLGCNLTPERLLNQLIEKKDYFYDVIKNDRVLLGILLGYGTENAILGTWDEIYSFQYGKERKEEFPLISKKARLNYEKESIELSSKLTTSWKLKKFDTFRIPLFGCSPSSEETKQLLTIYENNRNKIKAVAEDENFLKKTLLRLFTTTSDTLDIPIFTPQAVNEDLPEMDINKLASIVKEELKNEPFFDKSFITTYLNGVKAAESGRVPEDNVTLAALYESYNLKQDLEKAHNLKIANTYFNKKEKWIEMIPQKICYFTLQKASGKQVSRKSKDLTFHYAFQTLDGNTKDVGTIKSETLSNLIPGIALGIQGMSKGEIREIHIHPEYGYGEDNFFTKNAVIIAKIELIDFLESTSEMEIVEPYHLTERDSLSLLERYQTLKKEDLFDKAGEFWNFIKTKSNKIDFQSFEKAFSTNQPSLSKEERMKFIEQNITP